MKKSELKSVIKEEYLSMLKEKKKSEDVEDIDIEDTEDIDTSGDDIGGGEEGMDLGDIGGETSSLSSPEDVQKELMDALEAAKKLGDQKLVRQIGNALTYFTRSQITKDEQGAGI